MLLLPSFPTTERGNLGDAGYGSHGYDGGGDDDLHPYFFKKNSCKNGR